MSVSIKVKKLPHFDASFGAPSYETSLASGADLRVCLPNKDTLSIPPGARMLLPTGLAFEIPPGYEFQIRPRSGLSLKTHLLLVNSPGTIDADYRGELKIPLGNFGPKDEIIRHGDRLVQLIVAPVARGIFQWATTLSPTGRGESGFGSTGKS